VTCRNQQHITNTDELLGAVVHQSDGARCRAWLIINGPYTEPTQGRKAWRMVEYSEDGQPTGLVAQMYEGSLGLFHVPDTVT